MPATGWKQLQRMRGHERPIGKFAWSGDGVTIATPGSDGRLVLWNAGTGAVRATRDMRRSIWVAAYSPTGDTLAIVVSAESTPGSGDEEIEAMYSTYGLE